jgi:hypothetical protein
MPSPGSCVSVGTLVLNYSATNVAPTQKDQPLLSSKRRPHFQTHKRSWNEHKLGHKSRQGSKPRETVLARTRNKLLMCCSMLQPWFSSVMGANAELVPPFGFALLTSSVAPPPPANDNINISLQGDPFVIISSLDHVTFLSSTQNNAHFLILYLLQFPTIYPAPKFTSATRTRGHCIRTFRTGKFRVPLHSRYRFSLLTPLLLRLSLSLSLSLFES